MFRRFRLLSMAAIVAVLGSTFSFSENLSAPPAWAGNSGACEVDGGTAHNGLKVYPSHGSVFYIDTGQNQEVNAAYAGYRVENTVSTEKKNLWAKVGTFAGGVVALANPADAKYRIGDVAGNDVAAAFFLLQADQPTATNQTHELTIYDADPDLGGSSLYSCTFTFSDVRETIKASANKVTGITKTLVQELGGTVTVTVEGQSGQIGSGSSSPDGEVMWFSPAARSTWPSQSLQLETTQIRFKKQAGINCTGNWTSFYDDQLLFQNALSLITGAQKYCYEAVYTFRIRGPVAGNVQAIPIAQIASGTQIKHTDVTTVTSISGSSFSVSTPISVNIAKTASATVLDGDTDSKYEFQYTLTLANTSSNDVLLDQIVDKLDAGLNFYGGVDARFDGTPISDPSTNSDGNLVFQGPFSIPGSSSKTLVYSLEEKTRVLAL